MATGIVRFWAAARDAAGTAEEAYTAVTLADALDSARATHGEKLAILLRRCSYLVDDSPVGGRDHTVVKLSDGGTVDVLPPFAGG
jgi:molybdopterin converting factor small subunit